VKYGLAEGNIIDGNRSYGISIGHCDTDNVMRNNEIRNSGKIGILFRDDSRGQDFWANRNLIEGNKILDSGGDDGIAIDITGKRKTSASWTMRFAKLASPCSGRAFVSVSRPAKSSWPTIASKACVEHRRPAN